MSFVFSDKAPRKLGMPARGIAWSTGDQVMGLAICKLLYDASVDMSVEMLNHRKTVMVRGLPALNACFLYVAMSF